MKLVGLKTVFKEGGEFTKGVQTYVVGFNPHGLIDGLTSSGDAALNEMINERLRIYEAQIGYPTSVTSGNVKDVLKNSLMAFSAILQMKKWNDAKNLVTGDGTKLDIDHAMLPTNGITAGSAVIRIDGAGPGSATGWTKLTSPSVSNTVWANLVGELKETVILPPALANMTSYLISNYFSNHYNDDDGVSQLIEFIPNHSSKFEQLLDLFNNSIDGIRTLYNANPGLYAFMLQFIPHIALQDEDFRRDLSGRTITIIDDTKLLQSFDLDPSMYYAGGKDSMLTYGDENIVSSVFDTTPTQTLDIATVFYEMIFKSAGTFEDSIVKVLHYVKINDPRYGDYEWAIPSGRLNNASAFNVSQLNNVIKAMDKYPFDCVYAVTYTFNDVIGTLQISMADNDLKKGYNLYIVNGDDVGQVRDAWFKSAILGLDLPGFVNRVNNEGLPETRNSENKRKSRKNTRK